MKKRSLGTFWTITIACLLAPFSGRSEPIEDFYKGRTVSIIVGSGPGGSFDLGARLIAMHLRRFIPGNPTVIVQNMAGASSVRATEYLFNVAARDGSVLGDVQPTIVINKVLDPSLKYSPEAFGWVGRLRLRTNYGLAWHESPATTIQEARKNEVIFAANSPSGYTAMVPWALNAVTGTRIKVITGYESEATEWLAVQRKEAHGIGSGSITGVLQPDWLPTGKVRVMYTIGLKRTVEAPDAPTLPELATNDLDRSAMRLISSSADIGETLILPPGVSAEKTAAIRVAFSKMMTDPDFISDALNRQIETDFLDGSALSSIVSETALMPTYVITRLKSITSPPSK